MKNPYYIRAEKFIRMIAPYVQNCHSMSAYERAYERIREKYPTRRIEFTSGACRVCFITSDYVIKIDYSPANIAVFGGCEKEYSFYHDIAKNSSYNYLFAAITRYDYNDIPFYIMPRVFHVGDTEWDFSEGESDFIDEWVSDIHENNYGVYDGHLTIIDYADNRYGEEE